MLVSEKVRKGSGLTDSGRIQESKYYYQRGVAEDILWLKAVKQQFRRSFTTGIPRHDSWNTIYKALCTIFKEKRKTNLSSTFNISFVNIFHTELLLLITVWTHWCLFKGAVRAGCRPTYIYTDSGAHSHRFESDTHSGRSFFWGSSSRRGLPLRAAEETLLTVLQ